MEDIGHAPCPGAFFSGHPGRMEVIMTMQTVATQTLSIRATTDLAWSPPANVRPGDAGRIVASFVDAAATALGRATHYNSREEQQKAELAAHAGLLDLDRALYALLLTLPGVLDRARQVGIKNLLATPLDSASRVDPLVERRTLGAFTFTSDRIHAHRDASILPRVRSEKSFAFLELPRPHELDRPDWFAVATRRWSETCAAS